MTQTVLHEARSKTTKQYLVFILSAFCIGIISYGYSLIRAIKQPIDFDATGYVWLSKIIIGNEPSQFDTQHLNLLLNIRQMGYPILISPFVALHSSDVALRVSVSIAQLVMYFVACIFVYRAILLILDKRAATVVLALLFAIPFPYFYITEVLADSFSLSFAMIAISSACICVRLVGEEKSKKWYVISLLATALAMSIRKDNQYVGMICFASGIFFWRYPLQASMKFVKNKYINIFAAVTSLLSVSLAVISFRIPNWVITRRFLGAGSLEPPGYIESDVIVRFGLQTLKYFTITGQYGGSVSAVNQFVDLEFLSTLEKAWHYYFLKPFDGFLSITAKVFALLDWDVPFAFNNDSLELAPFLLSFANYVLVANGILGIGYFLYRSFKLDNRALFDWFLLIAGVMFVPYLAIHTLSTVEIRYGLPFLQIITISTGIFLLVLRDRRRVISIQLMIVIFWVPLSFVFSNWIRNGISV
jgi:hypothetical protein